MFALKLQLDSSFPMHFPLLVSFPDYVTCPIRVWPWVLSTTFSLYISSLELLVFVKTQKFSVITNIKSHPFLVVKILSPDGDFATIFWATYLSFHIWAYAKEKRSGLSGLYVPCHFSLHERRPMSSCSFPADSKPFREVATV